MVQKYAYDQDPKVEHYPPVWKWFPPSSAKKHSTRLTLGGSNESTQRVRVGAEPEVRITSADEINGKSTNLFALFRVH